MALPRVPGLARPALQCQTRGVSLASFHPRAMYVSARDFVLHLKDGSIQFGRDVKVAWGYLKRVMRGEDLTRQQRRHLNQTVADMFRLVPFSIFIIVPFLELLLPVALAMFPNMLPTSFQSQHEKADKRLRETKARIEYAKFLQDTLAEMAVELHKRSSCAEISATAEELTAFLQKLKAGEISGLSEFEISKFRQIFAEELSLWKLERPQLQELCRFMSVAPFGPDALLRVNLRMKLNNIKKDDRELYAIGVDNLPYEEVKLCCQARGIRTDFPRDHPIPREHREAYLRKQLDAWLHFSLRENLSQSLLLMLQVFSITQVAEVGQEVHKAVTADIQQAIDRERELALIQEELDLEKKERDQSRLVALAKAMKAEGALQKTDHKVQVVQGELREVKQDIEDTIRSLKELGERSGDTKEDDRTKITAARLESRLASMIGALDHALSILPKRLSAEEDREKRLRQKRKAEAPPPLVHLTEAERMAGESVKAVVVATGQSLVPNPAHVADPSELHDTIDDLVEDPLPPPATGPPPPPLPPQQPPQDEERPALPPRSPTPELRPASAPPQAEQEQYVANGSR